MSLQTLLNDRCDLQQESLTATGAGTHTRSWTTLLQGLRCRRQPIDPKDQPKFAQMAHNITHVVYAETRQSTPAGYATNRLNEIALTGNQKRLRFSDSAGGYRYLTLRGCRDFDEQARLCSMVCEEQPYSQASA